MKKTFVVLLLLAAPLGAFCQIRVDLRSDDEFIAQMPKILTSEEFSSGEVITCGSWIKQEDLERVEKLVREHDGDDAVQYWYDTVGNKIKCMVGDKTIGSYGDIIELK